MTTSLIQVLGAVGFGALIGWYVYYINRYRKAEVQLTDLVTLVGVLGGGTILAIFPQSTDLFGAYGIGLALGFFGYFLVLLAMVLHSPNFDSDWFLDGRRKKLPDTHYIPGEVAPTTHALGGKMEPGKDQPAEPPKGGLGG
jgi:hypothetical protein